MTAQTEVVRAESTAVAAPDAVNVLQIIERAARDPSADIEKMERLMALYERVEAKKAEAAFNEALTACQRELRIVAADANNPQTHSKYASYAALDRALRPVYTKHGISISYGTEDSPKPEHVRVIAYVARAGHTRKYQVDMPADGKGAKGGDVMTKTHATGAAMSYGARYLLKGIFNISVGEDDDDGNGIGNRHTMPEGQRADFEAAIDALTDKSGAEALWKSISAATAKLGDVPTHDALRGKLFAKAKGLK